MSDNTHGGHQGGRQMDYIADTALYKAVMFAKKMIGEGTPSGIAITRAARYYGVHVSAVSKQTGCRPDSVGNDRQSPGPRSNVFEE